MLLLHLPESRSSIDLRALIIFTYICWASCAHEQKAHGLQVGTVYRCGQQKCNIFDVHGLCQRNQSILKPVFRRFWRTHCAYVSLRCLDLEMWQFSCWRQTWLLYPCVCTLVKKKECNGNKHKKQLNKIDGWTRVVGIIRYVWHPYCFSFNKVKSSRDVRYVPYYPYYPCFYTFLYCHPYFTHQFYSIVFMLVCIHKCLGS